jgi:hypothetical protein
VRQRQGAGPAASRLAVHVAIEDALRKATVPAPHTITRLDTTRLSPGDTTAAAMAWAADISVTLLCDPWDHDLEGSSAGRTEAHQPPGRSREGPFRPAMRVW